MARLIQGLHTVIGYSDGDLNRISYDECLARVNSGKEYYIICQSPTHTACAICTMADMPKHLSCLPSPGSMHKLRPVARAKKKSNASVPQKLLFSQEEIDAAKPADDGLSAIAPERKSRGKK